jgi:hypothetical protein
MPIEKTPTEARQGQTSGIGRRVLLASLAIAAVVFIAGALIMGGT